MPKDQARPIRQRDRRANHHTLDRSYITDPVISPYEDSGMERT